MTEPAKGGQPDLEKELTCSICTEVLYQPLTLLDCLHTFCGSCLKFWFQWQASQNSDPRKNPYTCPSCRASVRATSVNAQINTLLEMFLLANPGKGKTQEEKDEIAAKYKKGEDVIPKPGAARNDLDETSRRMVEEAREMSLRDLDGRSPHRSYERGVRHRHHSRDRRQASDSGNTERGRSSADSRSQARHIEHQSSLRSLISTDEVSSADMVEEILRQIEEEGLIDGIDVHNLSAYQEDELSEKIAEAYRRRHHRGTQSPRSRHTHSGRATLSPPVEATSSGTITSPGRRHARSTSATDERYSPSHPPTSRPHLLDADAANRGHRRGRSSEGRRQTSPVPRSPPVHHQAARSATDLSTSQRNAAHRERRVLGLSEYDRGLSEPRIRQVGDVVEHRRRDARTHASPSDIPRTSQNGVRHAALDAESRRPNALAPEVDGRRSNALASQADNRRPSASAPEVDDRRPSASAPEVVSTRRPSSGATSRSSFSQSAALIPAPQTNSRPTSSSSPSARSKPATYPEPSVKCDRCGKTDLQYELHEYCSVCNNGNYNLCHRCYREGKGCLSWYGFGDMAWHRFQRGQSQQDPPHVLIGRKYLEPHPASVQRSSNPADPKLSTEDPSKRLLTGAFCSLCHTHADDCFWQCPACNDGEWGFCNTCVNTGHCCTHPLLPIAHISAAKSQTAFPSTNASASFAPISSPNMMLTYPPSNLSASGQYRPLTFSTICNLCRIPVQPNQSRFHCYACPGDNYDVGNYDICSLCYAKLVASGRISAENGDKGWRRCLKGHRMIKFYFEDTPQGQRRIIVNDLVGGHFWEDKPGEWIWVESNGQRRTKSLSKRLFQDTPDPVFAGGAAASSSAAAGAGSSVMVQSFPPDGGVGMVVSAIYARLPAEDSKDELEFPRRAEIREVDEVTADWYRGAYAGRKGLFPANHVRVEGVVRM